MSDAKLLVPAAQYDRKSTEHQQYSLENQSIAIEKYAESHGFRVVLTYFDAKTGLVFKHRAGLRQLLQDVVAESAPFRVILVYDVSRRGRFQDTDESVHYEFLSKSAGIPVHYCAETFANDGSLPSLIMKALKRTMAGGIQPRLGGESTGRAEAASWARVQARRNARLRPPEDADLGNSRQARGRA